MTFRKTAVLSFIFCISASAADPGTELLEATKKGQKDRVVQLLDKAAPVNAKDKNGRTPLMLSAQHHHAEIVRLLLAKGADPDARDRKGWTAFGLAIVSTGDGQEATLRALPAPSKLRLVIAAKWAPDNLYSSCLVSPAQLAQHVAAIQPDAQVVAAFRDIASISAKGLVEVSADDSGDAVLQLRVRPGASCLAQKASDNLSLAVDAKLVRNRDDRSLHEKTYGGGLKGLKARAATSPAQYGEIYGDWAKKHAEAIYGDVLEAWLRAEP